MDDINSRILKLENDNTLLRTELGKKLSDLKRFQEMESEYGEERKALLYMLEDINETTARAEIAEKEWTSTFDSISDPIFIHDSEFHIVRANRAYQEIAGVPFIEIIGRPYYKVFPKLDNPHKTCLKVQEEAEEEISLADMGRIYRVKFYPMKYARKEKGHSIHVLEDITEVIRTEQNLQHEIDITTHMLMISDATRSISDVDKLMEEVTHCITNILRCDASLFYLWDKEKNVFRPSQEYGLDRVLIPLFRAEVIGKSVDFIKDAFETKGPSISDVTPEITKSISWLGGVNTVVTIPLISVREHIIGMIFGIYKGLVEFTDRDIKVMQGVSHQVAISLEQAQLYRESLERAMELSHKIETIQVMHDIDRSILSTLEQEEIMETVTRMVARLIPCDRVTISFVDKEREGFIWVSGFGVTGIPKGAFVPFCDTDAGEIVYTGRPQYVADLREIKEPLLIERMLIEQGYISHIRVPLVAKGEIIGLLSVGAKRPSAYSSDALILLEKFAAQAGVAIEHARLVKDLEELFLGTVKSLSSAIDAKSPWTAGHSDRVTKYALEIGRGMEFSQKELKDLELAGLLHDIGKIGTYESILDKPGKLNDEEMEIMKQHPIRGAEILSPIRQLKGIIPSIKYHQEFYDGKGYPEGLKGEDIPLFARILAVADTVDAMSADRPYRKGKSKVSIVAELKRCSGTQFDSKVVDVFLKIPEFREISFHS